MTLACVERWFGDGRAPHPVRWLADYGSPYPAGDFVDFVTALNLDSGFTPVRGSENNGVCEAFVKTPKRYHTRVKSRPDAIPVLQQRRTSFEDYYVFHPHSCLCMLSAREFIATPSPTPAACRVRGGALHSHLGPFISVISVTSLQRNLYCSA